MAAADVDTEPRLRSGDRVWVHSCVAPLLAGQDPFSWAHGCDGVLLRAQDARRTVRIEHGGREYVVKSHAGCGWAELASSLARGSWPVIDARTEVQAARRLAAAGIATLDVVAWGVRGVNPAQRRSFLITRALPVDTDLDAVARSWRERGGSVDNVRRKRQLIDAVARLARRLHAAGVNHRDLYLDHLLLDATVLSRAGARPPVQLADLHLVDLHRAQWRHRVPRRWRVKDLGSLHYGAMVVPLSRRDRLRFLRAYFRMPLRQVLADQAALLRAVEARGQALWRKGLRLGLVS